MGRRYPLWLQSIIEAVLGIPMNDKPLTIKGMGTKPAIENQRFKAIMSAAEK